MFGCVMRAKNTKIEKLNETQNEKKKNRQWHKNK